MRGDGIMQPCRMRFRISQFSGQGQSSFRMPSSACSRRQTCRAGTFPPRIETSRHSRKRMAIYRLLDFRRRKKQRIPVSAQIRGGNGKRSRFHHPGGTKWIHKQFESFLSACRNQPCLPEKILKSRKTARRTSTQNGGKDRYAEYRSRLGAQDCRPESRRNCDFEKSR